MCGLGVTETPGKTGQAAVAVCRRAVFCVYDTDLAPLHGASPGPAAAPALAVVGTAGQGAVVCNLNGRDSGRQMMDGPPLAADVPLTPRRGICLDAPPGGRGGWPELAPGCRRRRRQPVVKPALTGCGARGGGAAGLRCVCVSRFVFVIGALDARKRLEANFDDLISLMGPCTVSMHVASNRSFGVVISIVLGPSAILLIYLTVSHK